MTDTTTPELPRNPTEVIKVLWVQNNNNKKTTHKMVSKMLFSRSNPVHTQMAQAEPTLKQALQTREGRA